MGSPCFGPKPQTLNLFKIRKSCSLSPKASARNPQPGAKLAKVGSERDDYRGYEGGYWENLKIRGPFFGRPDNEDYRVWGAYT